MSDQRYLVLDYETRSRANLKKVGGFEYAVNPSTQILCVAWKIGTRATLRGAITEVWSPAIPGSYKTLRDAFADPAILIVAHNALFEQLITRHVLTRLMCWPAIRDIPVDRWICTAAQAAALALPRNLEGACAALKLPVQKDMDGRRLILKYCKPRKPTKKNPAEWHSSLADLKRIMLYCQTDVYAEAELFLSIPELNPKERELWCLDQRINQRGVKVDRELVEKTLALIEEETRALNVETTVDFGFHSVNQRDGVLKWLESEGVYLPDLKAKTVADAITENVACGDALRLLELRQALSKTSTAKYLAFESRSRHDGRARDNLLFHGASTGRWNGTGLQVLNFPRGSVRDTGQAAEIVKESDLGTLRMIYGNPMDLFSSLLRACIVAGPGREFFCGDFASIEVRVLFWLAKHEEGLTAYREDRDLYRELATHIYRKELDAITKPEREVGKRGVLGAGFGMGHKKFRETCKQFGQEITEEVAQLAITAYRAVHQPVGLMWSNLEKAALAATRDVGKRYTINRTTWFVRDGFLYCELPSKRRLAYYQPEIRYEPAPWGEKRPVLYHWGVDSLSKKWVCAGTYGGKLTENVVQAVARDVLAEAMIRLEKSGYEIDLPVHDEILSERAEGSGSLEEFTRLMSVVPEWAGGLPVKVESWTGERYKK